MKKKTINAFTLVEMLIVIVIIGILIAALMPRMQAAQWRARDVSRKTALSQIQTAIVTYQWDTGQWPAMSGGTDDLSWATDWIWVDVIKKDLVVAWMNSVPEDPLKWQVEWLWSGDANISKWNYWYIVTKRNWTPDWWFVLMAKTEIVWGSNWVNCTDESFSLEKGWITNDQDIKDLSLCESFTQTGTDTCKVGTWDEKWKCEYSDDSMLRYIVLY